MLPSAYLAQKLTPYPLPTKDGGALRIVGDAHAYIVALSKNRALRAHWQHAGRLMLQQGSAAALTRRFHVALFMVCGSHFSTSPRSILPSPRAGTIAPGLAPA